MLWQLARSCPHFLWWHLISRRHWKSSTAKIKKKNPAYFMVRVISVDGLLPNGARASASIVLTKFGPVTYKYWPLELNSLGANDAIWRQRSGSILTQVMACCLTAPSHYLNQCWLVISEVVCHSSKGKFTRDNSAINYWNYLINKV